MTKLIEAIRENLDLQSVSPFGGIDRGCISAGRLEYNLEIEICLEVSIPRMDQFLSKLTANKGYSVVLQ